MVIMEFLSVLLKTHLLGRVDLISEYSSNCLFPQRADGLFLFVQIVCAEKLWTFVL